MLGQVALHPPGVVIPGTLRRWGYSLAGRYCYSSQKWTKPESFRKTDGLRRAANSWMQTV